MADTIEISDDDDSFVGRDQSEQLDELEAVSLSDDVTDNYLTSDDDFDLPAVQLKAAKSSVIKKLFPNKGVVVKNEKKPPISTHPHSLPSISMAIPTPKGPGFEKPIGGVKVHLPVDPYGSQIAVMSKVITAINKGQNCLLESPTGSGKTLALLCGALAWQRQERNRISQNQAQQYFSYHPELSQVKGVVDYIASPQSKNVSPEKLFGKTVFGEKSIYDNPADGGSADGTVSNKRLEPLEDSIEGSPKPGQVTIHKKRRLDSSGGSKTTTPEQPGTPVSQVTPKKSTTAGQPETPENIRKLYSIVENLRLRTSMHVDCSLPIIYYGARTHKQLQQVVKEFSRTAYCGEAQMTILSSREYSCIREFDKSMWGNKNDMCKGCTKMYVEKETMEKKTNCEYYNNRQALSHKTLPPAFDLEDLISAGKEVIACPFYAARAMATVANIVFCPYNYLIEPSIRSSLQIKLEGNIVLIDEAHNIEDICRDAATYNITRDNVLATLKELEMVAEYRFANQNIMSYIEKLIDTVKHWDQWFENQTALVINKPVNNHEAVHMWQVDHFIDTLNNHNIGLQHYNEFSESAEIFCRQYRESPQALYGVTQTTATLIDSLMTVLGYLFRDSGKYKDNFKPALIRNVFGSSELSEARAWRNSHYKQWADKDRLSLRLLCMSPAVVFEGLKVARCVLLASGTLTPMVSLHSELATEFPLQVSPNHVIPSDRVWIGTLSTCPNGQPLECNSRGTDMPDVQDGLGQAVLWVCQVTPHGVLCFLPSYMLMDKLQRRWQETGTWKKLNDCKHVFMEQRAAKDHNDIMDDYYKYSASSKGALLFAVYRGKVSEGMDFKDHQARAVVTVGVPYPNTFDMAVKEKMIYNDKHAADRQLLTGKEWLRVQAYRALNQAVGRCVRHRGDWGAVLLVDARFQNRYYTEHLSKWVRNFLGNNHYTYQNLVNNPNSLESFMQNMKIRENEEV